MSNDEYVFADSDLPEDVAASGSLAASSPTVVQYDGNGERGFTYDPVRDTVTVASDGDNPEAQYGMGMAEKALWDQLIGAPDEEQREALEMLADGYVKQGETTYERGGREFDLRTGPFAEANAPELAVLASGADPGHVLEDATESNELQYWVDNTFAQRKLQEELGPLQSRVQAYADQVRNPDAAYENVDAAVRLGQNGEEVDLDGNAGEIAEAMIALTQEGAQFDGTVQRRDQALRELEEHLEFSDGAMCERDYPSWVRKI